MNTASVLAALRPQSWSGRGVARVGGLCVAVVVALAGYDIVRSYRETVADTGRELDSHARVIAEQTARSLQAIDVVLRHLAKELQSGTPASLSPDELHAYLKDQAVGLVQADGLVVFAPDGAVRAVSLVTPDQQVDINVAETSIFRRLKAQRGTDLVIEGPMRSPGDGRWVFPIGRRIESPDGRFVGAVGARGHIPYFERFYQDVHLEPGTTISLLLDDGRLVARYPAAVDALGRRFGAALPALPKRDVASEGPLRAVSPVDGVERFAAIRPVPEYPLAVAVTRATHTALAPWRELAYGTALRTLALAAFAAVLLTLLTRQLGKLVAARNSLAASQERFTLAVAGSDDGIWDWDYRTGIAFASARAREILGLPPGPEAQSIDEWFAALEQRLHPEDTARRTAAIEAHLAGATPTYEGEYRVRNRDGGYRWVRIRGLCVRRGSDRPHRMAGSVSDIDAFKRADGALRESEQRYARAIVGSNDGITDWDLAADRMFCSERALRILGIESDVTVRTRAQWMALIDIHPDDRARHERNLRDHLEGRTPVREGEYRVRSGAGPYRWVRIRGVCVRDATGRALRLAGSVSDIDARKNAEQALRQSDERYQLAVAGANQGLWDWDLASDMLFLSPRAQEMMGFVPGEPQRPRREWIDRCEYHPDDIETVRTAMSRHLRGETAHFAVEYRQRHTSGEWHWYRERGLAVRDGDGRPYRMAGSLEDITESRAAEADRGRLEGKLRQAQKLEAIGTLAGGIAHDFNNILAAILGYGEMAQKDAAEGTPMRRHLDAALSAGMRAKSLVERILAFSRSGIGERVPVNVQAVVEEALDLVAAGLPGGVHLERRLTAGDAAVLGDPTQVHQVVLNLAANAIQSMKSGGALSVSLDVREFEARVVATSELAAGRYVRLQVRDAGSGIAPSTLERIFDPFFTTKEIGVGTGLGLSLVHGIVTDLGGGIDVESRLGIGTVFSVYLPWHGNVAAALPVAEAVAPGTGETILLVDDEEALVRLGEEMIAELGYEPVGFTSSSAALASFTAAPGRFHAVLSDEAMPEMTGSELALALRRIRPDIPIVLMSGYVTAGLAARAREAGVVEVLNKPLATRDIARSLANALGS